LHNPTAFLDVFDFFLVDAAAVCLLERGAALTATGFIAATGGEGFRSKVGALLEVISKIPDLKEYPSCQIILAGCCTTSSSSLLVPSTDNVLVPCNT